MCYKICIYFQMFSNIDILPLKEDNSKQEKDNVKNNTKQEVGFLKHPHPFLW